MSVPVGLSFLQSSFSYSQSLLPPKPNLLRFRCGNHGGRLWWLLKPIPAPDKTNRTARHARIRKKMTVRCSTLAAASTQQKAISEEIDYTSGPTIEVAKKIGEAIAKSCLEKGIVKVAFDRGGYPYHGRIEALADAAREHGLQF
ncbi:unnamed protein product [Rhodiola kirilowii]